MLPSENKELVLRGAGLAYRVMWPRGGSGEEQSRAFMSLYTMRDIAAGTDYRWDEKLTNDQIFDEMAVVFHRAIEDQNRKPKYSIGSRLTAAAETQRPETATV